MKKRLKTGCPWPVMTQSLTSKQNPLVIEQLSSTMQ